jgi:hypothetical protein
VTAEEGKALDAALKEFHDAPEKVGPQGDYADYAKPLLAFLSAHPKSNWRAAIYTNLGLGYYHAGYWSCAFSAYEKASALGRNVNSSPQARLMIDRAVGELAKMHARVGHDKELGALPKDIGDRPIGGPATETIAGARAGLWNFRHQPDTSYLCGPNALKNVLAALGAKRDQIKIAEDARSGPHGFSLTQVAALADKTGLKYTLIARKPGQSIPVPSVIHWNVHHYAAITGMRDGLYHVEDPTFGDAGGLLVTAKAIDAEGSGYFLVPAAAANPKAGWRMLAARSAEAGRVYGMGTAFSHMAGVKMPCDRKMGPTCGCEGTNSAPTKLQQPAAGRHDHRQRPHHGCEPEPDRHARGLCAAERPLRPDDPDLQPARGHAARELRFFQCESQVEPYLDGLCAGGPQPYRHERHAHGLRRRRLHSRRVQCDDGSLRPGDARCLRSFPHFGQRL